jgi:hypothetical protein
MGVMVRSAGSASAPQVSAGTANTFVFASTGPNEVAHVGNFTHHLTDILEHGIPNVGAYLTLSDIYSEVSDRMNSGPLQSPVAAWRNHGALLALAPNPAVTDPQPSGNP